MDKFRIIITITLIFLSGCNTTPKPYFQKSIKILKPETYSKVIADYGFIGAGKKGVREYISFYKINDSMLERNFHSRYPEEINISPGVQKLWIEYAWFTTRALGCVEVDAKAGVNYIVRKELREKGVMFWLETMDGKVVGALCS